jgi:hypothetical protein
MGFLYLVGLLAAMCLAVQKQQYGAIGLNIGILHRHGAALLFRMFLFTKVKN